MVNEFISLGTIFDYIEDYYPETKFWDGYSKHEPRDKTKSYKHRAGLPNEIRIEFDSEDTNKNFENIMQTCINLYNARYNFAVFYVEGGRSPHIHIYDCDQIDTLTYEQRTSYRERFLEKFCPKKSNPDKGLCDEKHLCALEFATHFKYNKPKQLLNFFYFGPLSNQSCEFDIWSTFVFDKKKKKRLPKLLKKPKKLGDKLKQKKRDMIIGMLSFEAVFEKYGVKYKGKMAVCPFHADGNGSLSFTNGKGLWKCWGDGCGAKGDIITLIKLLEERKNGKSK